MADTKITALAVITTVDPANDVLPIVDVSNNSMAASGTTCRVTTNQLLGAGGTATLASATISGDLTVSGNGAFTGTGYVALQRALIPVGENGATSLDFRWYSSGTTYTTGARVHSSSDAAWTASSTPARLMFSTVPSGSTALSERYRIDNAGIHTWSNVGGVAGTAMTLNSTGLGVGGSPNISASGKALTISGAFTRSRLELQNTDGGTGGVTCGTISWFNGSNAIADITGAANSGSATLGSLAFSTGGSTRLTIDSSGNVGIGVTPTNKFQVRTTSDGVCQFIGRGGGTNNPNFQVSFADATTTTTINAGSGAGNPILTLATAGSDRLIIDASGNVIVNSAAIATTATDGFLYIPGCAGTPTGTPTAKTGRVPLVVDTTNNKLYFYSGGAWVAAN